jgi:hypothetical protein
LGFLLPEGVDGIIVEIKNSCEQKFSHYLSGHDAFFMIYGAQETKFDHIKVSPTSLSHTQPNLT